MKHASFAALLTAASSSAIAADAELAPLIVTASRMAQTADETLAPVAVITRQDIERQQVRSLTELLRGQPGVSIANNGGLGKRYDDVANTRVLGGYGLLDLRAGLDLAADWRLEATINNVFDKEYQTAAFYNQADRNYFLTLRYAPGQE
jgi:outer membrane cobalamin receptor